VSQHETNIHLRDPILVRATSSEFLCFFIIISFSYSSSPFLFCPLFKLSFIFDYLPSTYLFSAQLWNISEIIIFSFVITLVSRSNFLWSPSSCGLFFSWLYNWKLTPIICSELLTPSVSKCPSPLELKFTLRERFGRFLESKVEHLENRKLSHSK